MRLKKFCLLEGECLCFFGGMDPGSNGMRSHLLLKEDVVEENMRQKC